MAMFVKRLVSKKKRRLQEGGYELDLSYVTDAVRCTARSPPPPPATAAAAATATAAAV